MQRAMRGFHQDAEGHWVAELSCGHQQHVRHQPPFTLRPWVTTEQGRAARIGQCLDCPACDRRELPAGHAPYRRTPTFDSTTLPRALLERHDTKPGVWAVLHVVDGAVELIEQAGGGERRQVVSAGGRAVICPEVEHRLELSGGVALYLELWRARTTP